MPSESGVTSLRDAVPETMRSPHSKAFMGVTGAAYYIQLQDGSSKVFFPRSQSLA